MATEHVNVEALIQGIQLKDPRLYQILQELNRGLLYLQEEVFPLVLEAQKPPPTIPALDPPAEFTHEFTPITVRLKWSEVPEAFGYEVREGTVWDTSNFVFRINSVQADISPLTLGTHIFQIKTINSVGVYSDNPTIQNITIPPLGTITIDKQVIDNNVLLRWVPPTSTFRILHYEVKKEGTVLGLVDSTFFTIFENVAGTFTYQVTAIDVAGNRSPTASVTVEVLSPPDYALQDSRVSGLNGTLVNCLRLPKLPSILACVDPHTWAQHFERRSWTTIQNQIDAGYPIYIQPSALTGSYTEIFDYGVIIHNTIVTATWNQIIWSPGNEVAVNVKMRVSDDGLSYSAPSYGASQYFGQLRYLELTLEFVAPNDKALVELYNLTVSLNVKRENDGGEVNALSTDAGGTIVYFNKEFRDIESITATTKSVTEPFVVIFDFVDIPNPTFFKVFVFDTMGARVTRIVDWKARGIV